MIRWRRFLVLTVCFLLVGCQFPPAERIDNGVETLKDAYPIINELPSPDGKYVAVASTCRTYVTVSVVEIESGMSWEFKLPDGSAIPECTFLPENWGVWQDQNTFLLTVGRGGDAGEQHTYYCAVESLEDCLQGTVFEQTSETLPCEYDFDHDGVPDEILVVTLGCTEKYDPLNWYKLRIGNWSQEAYAAHVGWVSIFALKIDGQDYLLRYSPHMSTGCAYFDYQIFSLNEAGDEVFLKENSIEFDVNFSPTLHNNFDPAAIAAFLEEVHAYLDDSTLLLSTEGGGLHCGGSGKEFREDFDFWNDYFCPYDEEKSLEENLQTYMEMMTAARSGQT